MLLLVYWMVLEKFLNETVWKEKNIFCMFILPPSIYLSWITSVISDTLIFESVNMPQFYVFDVFFSLKNEIILVLEN